MWPEVVVRGREEGVTQLRFIPKRKMVLVTRLGFLKRLKILTHWQNQGSLQCNTRVSDMDTG